MTKLWYEIFSELFVNLSAGWFGAALIIPVTKSRPRKISVFIVAINIFLGIAALVMAFNLKALI